MTDKKATTIDKLLIAESPLVVLPSLAYALGSTNQALILQQVHYLVRAAITSNNRYVYIDDQWWVYNTINNWHSKYFYWISTRSLQRYFETLEEKGFLITIKSVKNPSDQTKWYRVNYSAIAEIPPFSQNGQLEEENSPFSQNGQLVDLAKMANCNSTPKWPTGYSKNPIEDKKSFSANSGAGKVLNDSKATATDEPQPPTTTIEPTITDVTQAQSCTNTTVPCERRTLDTPANCVATGDCVWPASPTPPSDTLVQDKMYFNMLSHHAKIALARLYSTDDDYKLTNATIAPGSELKRTQMITKQKAQYVLTEQGLRCAAFLNDDIIKLAKATMFSEKEERDRKRSIVSCPINAEPFARVLMPIFYHTYDWDAMEEQEKTRMLKVIRELRTKYTPEQLQIAALWIKRQSDWGKKATISTLVNGNGYIKKALAEVNRQHTPHKPKFASDLTDEEINADMRPV